MTLYLDMDGVLADFDKAAEAILGMPCHKYEFIWGPKRLWERLNDVPWFWSDIEPMADMPELVDAVAHLRPKVLTALPRDGADTAAARKQAWIVKHLGPDWTYRIITCRTHEKPNFCMPGDIMVDDRALNLDAWKARGGHYVVHTSAAQTIQELRALNIIPKEH